MITRRAFLASVGIAAPSICLGQPFSLADKAFTSNALIYPLDLGITFTGAWGMAPLSRASGNLFTLRRVSDNAEETISRLRRGPNYIAIESFLAATSGKVKTLTDQSAGGNNAENTTAATQPNYVTAIGGRAAASFAVSSSNLLLPSAPTLTGRNFSKYYVFGVRDRTSSAMANWPAMIPYDRHGASVGLYSTVGNRTTSTSSHLAWTTFPQSSAYTAGNCNINVFVCRSNASNTHFRINEISADSATLAGTAANAMTDIGRGGSGGFATAVCLLAALVGPAHTAAEEARVLASLQALFSTKPKTKIVFFDGDSITAGHLNTTSVDEREFSWPFDLMVSIDDESVMANNRAVSSSQIVDGTGDPNKDLTVWAPVKLDAYLSSIYAKKVLVVMAGSNDISVINAAGAGLTTYDRLVAYCQARTAAGWPKIIVVNCIPRLDFVATIKETERLDYNSRIAANANTDWSATIDAAALDWTPGGVWTTNYQGATGLHPNAAGRTLLVNAVKSTLVSML